MSASPVMLALPGILRGAGCEVVEYDGWRDRGRPYAFTPRGVILHHDGSPVGPAQPPEAYAHFLFVVGRPSEGIPAPLCNTWIDYYGRWWIGAAGRANHAGTGSGWGVFPKDQGNQYGIGVEMDNTTDEPTTPDQYEALHVGLPAIFVENGWDPAHALGSHKEYAPGRKFDPDDIDMPALRSYVAAHLHQDGGDDDMTPEQADQLEALYTQLLKDGYGGSSVSPGQRTTGGGFKTNLSISQGNVNKLNALDTAVKDQSAKIDSLEAKIDQLIAGQGG